MNSLALEPIYGSYAIALSISLVLLLVVLRFTPRIQSRSRKRWLVGCRCISALLLVLAILRPTIISEENQTMPTSLIFAADQSLSMTLADGKGEIRSELQSEIWRQITKELAPLKPDLNLKLLAYGDQIREIENPNPNSLDQLQTTSSVTDVAGASTGSFDYGAGSALSGVILVGDGTQTSQNTPESSQLTLETLRGLGIPLWTIPVGKNQDDGPPRDIAIDSVPQSLQLFAGNQSSIDFQVIAKSLAGIEIPLSLSWIDQNGQESIFATRAVVPTTSDDAISVSIPFTAPEPGSYQLKIEAETASDEITISNNQQLAFVDTREGGGRILYLEGSSTMEQAFIRRALRRFPDLDLEFKWIPETSRDAWPVNLKREIESGDYDIFIIGNLDSAALGETQINAICEQIASGASLLTLGGKHAYSSGGYQKTDLAEVLPVTLPNALDNPTQQTGSSSSEKLGHQIDEAIVPKPTQLHPVVDLGSSEVETNWKSLPPLLGANRWSGVKNLPGVITILEADPGIPLMVLGEYGQGRVGSVAFDSSWRWWSSGRSDVHRRFWRQVMLWLLSRENLDDDDLIVELNSRRIASDTEVDFSITSSDPANDTFGQNLKVTVLKPDGSNEAITTELNYQQGKLLASGTLPELPPGIYRLRAEQGKSAITDDVNEVTFQVIQNSVELTRSNANPAFLEQLAMATQKYGGKSYRPEDVSELCKLIRENHAQSKISVTSVFRLGEDPISGWVMFVLFTVAMTTEWILRRRWGLS